ncbi:MAG: DNA polymerase IV, partial [Pseudomonadota bacterium]
SRLWGAGKCTVGAFDRLGIHTIGELRQRSRATLTAHFGRLGEHFWRLARGIDERPVVPDREAKSISHETTFAEDLSDTLVVRGWLMLQTEQVAWRLRRHELYARTVQLKVRFADFSTVTRAHTLVAPTQSTQSLWDAASDLLAHRLPPHHPPLRLIGVGVSGLETARPQQNDLFTDAGGDARKDTQAIDAVLDDINRRFGKATVHRATVMRRKPG